MKEQIIAALKSWQPEMKLTVVARFIQKGSDRPLHGKQYTVMLYDRDIFEDDYLGKSGLNEHGEAHITFYPSQISSLDSAAETEPDLYLLLFDGDVVHAQSKILEDADFSGLGKLSAGEGALLHMGTFMVD